MATITEKTKTIIEYLNSNFTEEDYNLYINGDLSYSDLCTKYNSSDYLMSTFFKQKGLVKRRKVIKNSINEFLFDDINSSESAYIFGFYIADGCITSQDYFSIQISSQDIELLENIKLILAPSCKIHITNDYVNQKTGITTHSLCKLIFKNKHISEILNKYGCGYNKTYLDKSIINIVPKEYMFDFIRGYFDGDGCISSSIVVKNYTTKTGESKSYSHTNVIFKITSKTPLILNEIKDFLLDNDINTFIQIQKNTYEICTCSLEEICKLYNKLYNGKLCLKRKFEKFKSIVNPEVN